MQDASDHSNWETRYILLLWLSILVLVPFDLRTVDSFVSAQFTALSVHMAGGIIGRIIWVCKTYLPDAGAVRDSAAICLSRLLTRPDMDTEHLRSFCDWASSALTICTAPAAAVMDPSAVLASSSASLSRSAGPEDAPTPRTASAVARSGSMDVVSNTAAVATAGTASFVS
ncbi:hypothetical protein EON66_04150 [archaeon]|nr:MAG: hypothetical protein EON66_04150 [archaeon]